MKLKVIFLTLALMLMEQITLAKEWRGIIPLKSTREDVERRFGKPNQWGNYEFKEERVSFDYGDGPCKGLYLLLGEDNCKCLASESAVMRIFVEPTVSQKLSVLKPDIKEFTRTPISPFPHTFEYSNRTEGITYTVDESEDAIKHITYYPSTVDCQEIIRTRAPRYRNVWRGLRPLHSNRKDVEALFGSPECGWETPVTYETDHESITAKYSDGNCDVSGVNWKVPRHTLIELTVNPNPGFFLQELHLDPNRYERHEIFPYPEIDNPPKVWEYVDKLNGISIRTQSTRPGGEGEETVVSITYAPRREDENLRCPAQEVTNEQEGDVGFLKIDAYGNFSTSEESKRLNEFVTRLKTQPPIQAYIVAYGGRKSWPGEAKYRANCVKEYLVKKHKIDERWVTTIDGGYQEQAIVELYISLTGDPPITSPTLDRKDVQVIKNRRMSGQGKCRLTSRVPQRTLYNQERSGNHLNGRNTSAATTSPRSWSSVSFYFSDLIP